MARNVIVLVFDTLRSDYLGCYGSQVRTPAFERAAAEGVVFESAFSTAPGTPVSHASLYSGQYPSEHGVTGQYLPLPEDVPVLAEWFRDAGYDTFGITGPAKMGSDWGYDRGFDALFEPYYDLPPPASWQAVVKAIRDRHYRDYFVRKLTRGGREQTRFKFELLKRRIATELGRPFFVLCNCTTVHAPYDPPRPYKERATPEFSRPRWHVMEYLTGNRGRIDDPDIRLSRVLNMQYGDGVARFLADPGYLRQEEVQLLRDWYAATVTYLDYELGRFLKFYRRELADDTILVLTADHGEQLGEHGLWEHSYYFFDETLQVPLILVGPELPSGNRRADLVSLVDVFETLCERCGVDEPRTTSGQSLFSEAERSAVFMEYGERDPAVFGERSMHGTYLDGDRLRAFAAGRKAIRTEEYRFEVDSLGHERCFELPGQTEVGDVPGEVVDELQSRLVATLGNDFGRWPEVEPGDGELSDEVEGQLRELGYLA